MGVRVLLIIHLLQSSFDKEGHRKMCMCAVHVNERMQSEAFSGTGKRRIKSFITYMETIYE